MIKKTMRSILFIISITFSFGAMELPAQDSNLTPKKTKSKYLLVNYGVKKYLWINFNFLNLKI